MRLTLYHNPKCSTARHVLAALREAGFAPEIVDYLNTPPSAAELQRLSDKVGQGALAITRTKEALYKALGLDAAGTSEAQLITAVAQHPVLLNRPIVETEAFAMVVRPSATVDQLITRLQS